MDALQAAKHVARLANTADVHVNRMYHVNVASKYVVAACIFAFTGWGASAVAGLIPGRPLADDIGFVVLRGVAALGSLVLTLLAASSLVRAIRVRR